MRRTPQVAVTLVWIAVAFTWLSVLVQRLPYLDQIPVFDADVTTSAANMWVHNWWTEGPFRMGFTTPRSPLSIETPTMTDRQPYESWPPGAFVPLYLAGKLLNVTPSIPFINWFNVVMHGALAMLIAFTGYQLARFIRLGAFSAAAIGIACCFPALLPRGLVYIFSQVYDVVTAVLPYTALFLFLEALCLRSERLSLTEARALRAVQLVVIYAAFFVDWLAYTLFTFWLVGHWCLGRIGYGPKWSRNKMLALVSMPISAFVFYMAWRILAPGSLARTAGVGESLRLLGFKIAERMNLTDDHHITGFWKTFLQIHEHYYSPHMPYLTFAAVLTAACMLSAAFYASGTKETRGEVLQVAFLLTLCVVPFYVHMLVLYQHTAIHTWAVSKAVFAYALVPFAFVPISAIQLLRIVASGERGRLFGHKVNLAVVGTILSVAALVGSYKSASTFERPYLIGRIDRDRYQMWKDIGENTRFSDVVVSPVLEAVPISVQVGVTNKLVHKASDFADVDRVVEHVCGTFNVVVAVPRGAEIGAFATRHPSRTIETPRLKLEFFDRYPGKALGCP